MGELHKITLCAFVDALQTRKCRGHWRHRLAWKLNAAGGYLRSHPNKILRLDEIATHLWGEPWNWPNSWDNNVRRCILELRARGMKIETYLGRGYLYRVEDQKMPLWATILMDILPEVPTAVEDIAAVFAPHAGTSTGQKIAATAGVVNQLAQGLAQFQQAHSAASPQPPA